MIIGAEIALLVFGIYVLFADKFPLGNGRAIVGGKARILGIICLLQLPITFGLGILLGFLYALGIKESVFININTIVEVLVFVTTLIALIILGKKFYNEQENEHQNFKNFDNEPINTDQRSKLLIGILIQIGLLFACMVGHGISIVTGISQPGCSPIIILWFFAYAGAFVIGVGYIALFVPKLGKRKAALIGVIIAGILGFAVGSLIGWPAGC